MRTLHPPGSRGKVTLLAKTGDGVVARCYPAEEIGPILPTWLEMTAYVGLNRYGGPRGGGRPVIELTCLYADLDTYRQPEFMFLEHTEIERPSVHEPPDRQAEPFDFVKGSTDVHENSCYGRRGLHRTERRH